MDADALAKIARKFTLAEEDLRIVSAERDRLREALEHSVGVMETAVAELPRVRETREYEYVDDALAAFRDAIQRGLRVLRPEGCGGG